MKDDHQNKRLSANAFRGAKTVLLSFVTVIIVTTVPLLFGAVEPLVWSVYSGLMAGLFLTAWWREKIDFRFLKSRLMVFSTVAFMIYTLFQLIPLPIGLIGHLSPRQHRLLIESSALIDSVIDRQPLSYAWRNSLTWWIFLLNLLLFAVFLKTWMKKRKNMLRIVWCMLGLALFEAIYGLIQTLIPTMGVLWADVHAYLGDARGTFINRNHFAGFLEMVWPLGLAMIFILAGQRQSDGIGLPTLKKRLKKFLASDKFGFQLCLWTAMLFILLSLLFSKSRAGVVGALIGGVFFIALSHAGGKRFSIFTWLIMGLGFVFLLFYSNIIGFDSVIGRFLIVDESTVSRMDIWKDTVSMIKDHPLGVGLGNYELVMPVYNTRGPLGIRYTHAHNDYLEILAETGWPGFTFLVGGCCVFFISTVRKLLRNGPKMDNTRFFIGTAASCGMASILFHSIFDFNLHIPANLIYFVVLMILAANAAQTGEYPNDRHPQPHTSRT